MATATAIPTTAKEPRIKTSGGPSITINLPSIKFNRSKTTSWVEDAFKRLWNRIVTRIRALPTFFKYMLFFALAIGGSAVALNVLGYAWITLVTNPLIARGYVQTGLWVGIIGQLSSWFAVTMSWFDTLDRIFQ